jgi:uncharacterized protein YecT (DUF1311 family)
MIGGVTGALTLGVLFGLWARPELVGSKPTPAVEQPLTATDLASSGAAPQVPIALNPPAAETPPRAPGRLQTLPPAMAAAARMRAESTSRRPAAPQAPGPPTSLIAPTPPEAAETPPSPQFHTSFDCATARPGAEEMVCEDPALAAADRQMARAYRRATHSGIDLGDLSQEQRDWMAIREDAARHSPHALAQIYDQRIDELNRIADGGPMAGR